MVIGCGTSERVTSQEPVIAIQNTTISVNCSEKAEGAFYLNLHENESTSVDAALLVAGQEGGTVCRLVHDGGRNITFVAQGDTFRFDPNRMFTDAGARASLRALSVDSSRVSDEVVASVRGFARSIVSRLDLDDRPIVVALHNNTDDQYSTLSYEPGGIYERDAAAVHVQPGADPDDFFFVTEADLFEDLQVEGFNVVLQNNAVVTDDGSLSVYAAQRGLRYVNVEAQHGHTDEQARMIRALLRVLASTDGGEGTR